MSTTKPDSLEFIRAALAKGEKSGLSDKSPAQIVSDAIKALKMNSQLQDAIADGVKSGDAGEFYMNEIKRQLDWK
jgi:predicted transcriptional regulator